jgi:hypothetical protein
MRLQALIAQLKDGSFHPVALPDVALDKQLDLHRAARVAGGVVKLKGKDTPIVALLKMQVESNTRFPSNGLTEAEHAATAKLQAEQDKLAKAAPAAAPKKG